MKTRRLFLLLGTICCAGIAPAADDSVIPERLQVTERDLPAKDTRGTSKIEDFACRRGFDYATITRRAFREPLVAQQVIDDGRRALVGLRG
ncbi:MAG: hypothetical protein M3Y03_01475, partial [Verrucomicrobiota bacterium]|nr:hypothetical protein [Verrucomicrobiota bacterium]